MRADLDYEVSELDWAGHEEEARAAGELTSRTVIAAARRADTAPARDRRVDDDGSS